MQRVGAQRPHPAGANPAQPRLQCCALHGTGRRCRRLPPARRCASRIEVWDSGIGIPDDQQRNIFGEFYRLARPRPGWHRAGLASDSPSSIGLCRLLGHPIELRSRPAKARASPSSCRWPRAGDQAVAGSPAAAITDASTRRRGKLCRGDRRRRAGSRRHERIVAELGMPRRCRRGSDDGGARGLPGCRSPTRSDHLGLPAGRREDRFEAIDRLRGALARRSLPSSSAATPRPNACARRAPAAHLLLHKPVPPMALRAMLNHLLQQRKRSGRPAPATMS